MITVVIYKCLWILNRYQRIPAGAKWYQQAPESTNRCQMIPTCRHQNESTNRWQMIPIGTREHHRWRMIPTAKRAPREHHIVLPNDTNRHQRTPQVTNDTSPASANRHRIMLAGTKCFQRAPMSINRHQNDASKRTLAGIKRYQTGTKWHQQPSNHADIHKRAPPKVCIEWMDWSKSLYK